MKSKNRILVVIVIAQFCCTSLWFAGNAVMDDLVINFNLEVSALGHLTSAVQFGFITGTLVFAIFTFSDRYSPSVVFFISALFGALFNLGAILDNNDLLNLIIFRFLTGFFLAGIYPVGMKIAADYFEKGLGRSLGFLVGALVVGTAFPHLLKGYSETLPWRQVLIITTLIAALGGLFILLFVPNGPFRKASQKLEITALFKVFKNKKFRSAAVGYFGHMWELYTFWAFVPVILTFYMVLHPESNFDVSILSFIIIGLGGLSCVVAGFLSEFFGSKKVAFSALLISGTCCLVSPLILNFNSSGLLIGFLVIWGLAVIADSPLFSTLIANNVASDSKGTALTIVNCIGFSITIISIQLTNLLVEVIDPTYVFTILAIGPMLGLIALSKKDSTHLE